MPLFCFVSARTARVFKSQLAAEQNIPATRFTTRTWDMSGVITYMLGGGGIAGEEHTTGKWYGFPFLRSAYNLKQSPPDRESDMG